MRSTRAFRLVVSVVAPTMILAACGTSSSPTAEEVRSKLDGNVAFVTQQWPTDWQSSTIDVAQLVLGVGATEPRDAIPPIDEPKFEMPDAAATWLDEREPGALVELDGDARFYPLAIMTRHEIVNDDVGGVPVVVTFCPLCNTALAFERRVDGETLRFGVSGLLRNSDLVMWDDQTVSLWQQITGEGIVGAYAGTRLNPVSTAIVSFGDFRREFPDGVSLSRDTGFDITYGINRYEGYSRRVTPLFPVDAERDKRFPALERVVGVTIDDQHKAYPFSVLGQEPAINDLVGGVPIVVLWGSGDTADALDASIIAESRGIGTAIAFDRRVGDRTLTFRPDGDRFVDDESGSTWSILGTAIDGPLAGVRLETVTHRNEFWFVWTAFFGDGEVYES